jgi:hypothetical protein
MTVDAKTMPRFPTPRDSVVALRTTDPFVRASDVLSGLPTAFLIALDCADISVCGS